MGACGSVGLVDVRGCRPRHALLHAGARGARTKRDARARRLIHPGKPTRLALTAGGMSEKDEEADDPFYPVCVRSYPNLS
jgi:hypothetical protein